MKKMIGETAKFYTKLWERFLHYQEQHLSPDSLRGFYETITQSQQRMLKKIKENPTLWDSTQKKYLEELEKLYNKSLEQLTPYTSPKIDCVPYTDRRFRDKDWYEHPFFNYLRESYLLHSEYLQNLFDIEEFDEETRRKIQFYLKAYLDALSPSNFPFTNPEVIRETIQQKGENLIKGYQNFLKDQSKGNGFNLPALTNLEAFKVGKNLATTPGKVVFENEIFQLLQFLPSQGPYYEKPILIIPPWINKYYIFDLQPENSFIRWNTESGRIVYSISWVNPDASYAHTSFRDYILKGIDQAVEEILKINRCQNLHAVGFCVGGVALSVLMAYYQAKKWYKLNSATLLASPIDFREMGDLSFFVGKDQIHFLEKVLKKQGAFSGEEMMKIFSSLRANELIWPNYINSYLLGKEPPPMDFLFWNSDTTNIPAKMHLEYLKEFFLKNALSHHNLYHLGRTGIDLETVDLPCFIVATQKDHIVPWKAAFSGFQKLCNSVFILGGSGHIAGIINPPQRHKYGYWTSEAPHTASAEDWLKTATQHPGSWWNSWEKWLTPFLGERKITKNDLKSQSLEEAPGRYALQTAPILKESLFDI